MSDVTTDAAIEAALEKEMDFKDEPETAPDTIPTKTPEAAPSTTGQPEPTVEAGTPTDPSATPAAPTAQEPVPITETRPVTELQNHPTLRDYRLDKGGNVTDAQGQVVAAAGRERRWLETSESMRDYITHQREQITTLEQRATELVATSKDALDGIPARLGLNTQEVDLGLKLSANFKTDPVGTARYILAEAMKLGYNLEQIMETAPGSNSINMAAITRMIDEKLEPFTSQRKLDVEAQTRERDGTNAYNTFMQKFPDAAPHQDAIAGISNHYKIAPEDAYFQLKTWAAQRGLDFTRPLHAQLQQRATPPATTPSPTAPLPNGGIAPSAVTDTPQIADEDVDYDDIIKDAMREAGMAVT